MVEIMVKIMSELGEISNRRKADPTHDRGERVSAISGVVLAEYGAWGSGPLSEAGGEC